jgi:hypothetical protein
MPAHLSTNVNTSGKSKNTSIYGSNNYRFYLSVDVQNWHDYNAFQLPH